MLFVSLLKGDQKIWRSRNSDNTDELRKPMNLGECVSFKQILSPTLGLVPQMIVFMILTCYKYATISVDQSYRLLLSIRKVHQQTKRL